MLMSGHFAASLAMLLIAAIFYLVAIGTNSWSTSGQVLTFGLWKFCMDTEGKKEWRCVPNKTDFSLAAQAFSMLAVLCYAVSFLMYLAYIVFPSLGRSRPVTMALCLLGFSVVPRGGVCKFQINFYIADDIQRRQTTEYCPQHPEEELRAMDADKDGKVFAVLDDCVAHLLVYRYGDKQPFATYNAGGAAFDPRDVCFCEIGGRERLIVADCQSDSLHVLDVRKHSLEFHRGKHTAIMCLQIMTMIVYGVKVEQFFKRVEVIHFQRLLDPLTIAWSFAFAIVSSIIATAAGICTFLELRNIALEDLTGTAGIPAV
nr:hypothetical protein BaRGS_034178 [Batillaria attramentaria]